jgi:hypothetical protein
MPAGPIGSVWASGTWSDTAWEANTWADAGASPAATTGSRMRYGYRYTWAALLLSLLWGN